MEGEYYIMEGGEQTGPFTSDELIDMGLDIHTRVLSPDTGGWQNAGDMPEFFEYFQSLGFNFPTEDNLASFGRRLLAFVVDVIILCVIMDFILAFLISQGYMSHNIMALTNMEAVRKLPPEQIFKLEVISNGILILYFSICEGSRLRGTLGKRICGIMVVDADGRGLSFPMALLRAFGKSISIFFWFLGFVSILWTEHKQALHDFIARSYVIKPNR